MAGERGAGEAPGWPGLHDPLRRMAKRMTANRGCCVRPQKAIGEGMGGRAVHTRHNGGVAKRLHDALPAMS